MMENYIAISKEVFAVKVEGHDIAAVKRDGLAKAEVADSFKGDETHSMNAFLGFYELNNTIFAVIGKNPRKVSDIWSIYEIGTTEIYQVTPGPKNEAALALLKQGIELSPLYYSKVVDLSLNLKLQKNSNASRQHFIWNHNALDKFNQAADSNIGQPVIAGYIDSFKTEKFELTLISRRSSIRAGTRLWMRGADEEGNVANYVETEQIIRSNNRLFSYVQIRGSVPMLWTQNPDLSRLPPLKLADKDTNERYLNAHFERLVTEYGPVTAVSLTDHKGREKEITETFNELGGRAKDVHFVYFDFHTECRKMQYQNIDKLVKEIEGDLERMAATEVDAEGAVSSTQDGVVRTNCIDCLDRTNVVQSVLARRELERELAIVGAVCDYDKEFRRVWTANANAISLEYSGTPAMKTDFTATGKRTKKGALQDGKNAIVRYYVNTCCDGTRQDAYDAVTQAVPITELTKQPLLIVLLTFILALFRALFLIVTGHRDEGNQLLFKAKTDVVNKPRFRPVVVAEKKKEETVSK